jgi:predicted nucleic acid-binding protein
LRSISDAFPNGPLVLDASVVFNLLACRRPDDVLRAIGENSVIEERTLAEIKRHPIEGICHKEVLERLIGEGLVRKHRMASQEYALYLSLVTGNPAECLDDGESAAIAVAVTSNYTVVLDDGKARRIHRERFPSTQVVSSLGLFIAAGERGNWSRIDIRNLVANARTNARMNIVKGEEELFANLNF